MTYSTNKIEENLIAAYIERDDLFDNCAHLVSAKLFSDKVNAAAYKIIKDARHSGLKPDYFLVVQGLKKIGVRPELIPTYQLDHTFLFQPEQYVMMLFEEKIGKHLLPHLQDSYSKILNKSASSLDLMYELKDKINEIELVLNNVSAETSISDVVNRAISEIEELKNSKKKPGYTTGLRKLDEILGGLIPGVVVIGAPPSVGKTTLVVNIIRAACIDGDAPVMFFSLEMPATQIIKNIFSNMLEINTMAIRDGGVDDEQLEKIKWAKQKIKDTLMIDDTPAPTWQYIDAKLTKIRKKVPIEKPIIVIIDYIQLMDNIELEKKNRTDEAIMALRAKGLMNMWKKHNLIIIELSQLGREVVKEKRRPRMSDLKESGAIEANANVVMLLHRPDYYEENPVDENGNSLKGVMEIIVDKNRGGRRGYAYAKFEGRYSKLRDLTDNDLKKEEDHPF